jgi:hypothetical protein
LLLAGAAVGRVGAVSDRAYKERFARLHPRRAKLASRPRIEVVMRAEAEQLVETIKQSLGLLRRHL